MKEQWTPVSEVCECGRLTTLIKENREYRRLFEAMKAQAAAWLEDNKNRKVAGAAPVGKE